LPRTELAPLASYIVADQQCMAKAKNYFAWQGRLVTRELGRRVVEVGCGLGNFTRMLLDRDVIIALDAELACIERIKDRYSDQRNFSAFVCDAGKPDFPDLSKFRPDSCVCLNVLEHIEDDYQALRNMASVLGPGGVIVLIIPAFEALYGPIDHNLGHYRRYNHGSVRKLAYATGMRIRKCHYMNSVGFFGWWANARLFKREAQSEGQIEFFDRRVVPVLSRLEGLVAPPFGQSFFVVLEKP
jgi:SAM-dependent methyltransferase